MKKSLFILAGLFLVFSYIPQTETALVTHIIDGNTIGLSNGTIVKYLGIETPKENMPFYRDAKKENESLVLNKEIRLEYDKKKIDNNERILAYVFVKSEIGEIFVNAYLIKSGYAKVVVSQNDLKYFSTFKKLQQEAQSNKKGLWALPVSELKTEKRESNGNLTVYRTRTGKKYHKAGCRYLRRSSIPIKLKDAGSYGLTPCSVCRPPRLIK